VAVLLPLPPLSHVIAPVDGPRLALPLPVALLVVLAPVDVDYVLNMPYPYT
jgi:hypothetical protein